MRWSVLGESSMKIPESQDRKKPVTAAETTGKAPEKPIGRPPSIKKAPTFAEHLKSPNSIKPDLPTTTPIDIQSQSSRRSATEETEADAWQKAELAKIKDKYLFSLPMLMLQVIKNMERRDPFTVPLNHR
jgi:hypothetical protein